MLCDALLAGKTHLSYKMYLYAMDPKLCIDGRSAVKFDRTKSESRT